MKQQCAGTGGYAVKGTVAGFYGECSVCNTDTRIGDYGVILSHSDSATAIRYRTEKWRRFKSVFQPRRLRGKK